MMENNRKSRDTAYERMFNIEYGVPDLANNFLETNKGIEETGKSS
jgi:hypothetical protein